MRMPGVNTPGIRFVITVSVSSGTMFRGCLKINVRFGAADFEAKIF